MTGRSTADSGVQHGQLLLQLTAAVVAWDHDAVIGLREAGEAALGSVGFVEAVAIASGFNGINRVADAIGIPLDDRLEALDGGFWHATGIREFEELPAP